MAAEGRKYRGIVVTGRGFGAPAMSQPRISEVARRISDLEVVPGTLNVRLSKPFDGGFDRYLTEEELGGNVWRDHAPERRGIRITPVIVAGRYRGIIFQGDEPDYPRDLVEIISDQRLREALNLSDGDEIEFEIVGEKK